MDENGGPHRSRHRPNDVPLVTVQSPETPAPESSQRRRSSVEPITPTATATSTAQSPTSPASASQARQSSVRTPGRQRSTSLRPATIRLRRLPSSPDVNRTSQVSQASTGNLQNGGNRPVSDNVDDIVGRRRSFSAPQRPQHLSAPPDSTLRPPTPEFLPSVDENAAYASEEPPSPRPTASMGRMRSASNVARSVIRRSRGASSPGPQAPTPANEYDPDVIDFLDVVDPEVATLSTLNNVQNSLFVPDLGRLINRRPTYNLTRLPTDIPEAQTPGAKLAPSGTPITPYTTAQELPEGQEPAGREELAAETNRVSRSHSISSALTETHYAVLPHGVSLAGWSDEDKEELDDYVRHLMHSRRARFKRRMRAFGKYVRQPLGFFVTLYAFLITIFGLIWVLFLIGWISAGGRSTYDQNVIDNVLVALFAVVGDGLAPFRAVDTYHMCFIAHYHHLTWRLRRERSLPKLHNKSDLPPQPDADVEADPTHKEEFPEVHKDEFSVLSPRQQRRLEHHQAKFAKSHTFYKPHETSTHHAFPLQFLVATVVLLDCHSLLQIALGTCTWSINYHHRPQALTTTILCCSICCNITGGIMIAIGDRKTRKKDVIEKMFRQGLTEHAITKVKKRKMKRVVEDREHGISTDE